MKSNTLHAPARWIGIAPALLALVISEAAVAQVASPSFSKAFAPDTIGPGSTTTLTFLITNDTGVPADQLAFTDTLPAGVTIAAPANALSTCGGTLDAPEGGDTITLSDGSAGAFSECSISVDVTSSTPGVHMNVSGPLTWSDGENGSATADLTVATNRPGFTKSFFPDPLPLGSRSTLTFTIDNTLNPSLASSLAFVDNLPTGMEVADPANVSSDCVTGAFTGGVITAQPGTNVVSLGLGGGLDVAAVAAGATCTIGIDIVANAVGTLGNTSGELTSVIGVTTLSSGKASATLTTTAVDIALIKSFVDDPVPPGGTVDLEFTILNRTRSDAATGLSFDDDLDATLTGLAVVGQPTPDPPCGAGSTLSVAGPTISLTGGNLPPEGSCTFTVPLQVPFGAATGAYENTTTALTGDVGGELVTADPAFDVLFVSPAPVLSKNFLVDPVAAGGTTTLEFTITNTSLTSTAADIAFIDDLTAFLPFPVSVTLPPAGFCGPGATMAVIFLGTDRQGLSMTGGSRAPGDSCTFSVDIDIPPTMPGGVYVNTTEPITATVDNATVTGNHASDTLTIVAAPSLVKEFTDDPVPPGGTVTLQFTLTHDAFAPTDATGVTFTDDLAATLTGLTGTGLPLNHVCGPNNGTLTGSTGDTLLTFSGATLTPGQVCTFPVTLQVDATAASGIHTNTTSDVTATVAGITAPGNPGQDDLVVTGFLVSKEFTDDPVIPGGMVTLEFTFDNTNGAVNATNVTFTDNLADVLPGLPDLTAVAPPPTPCGGSLSLLGSSFLSFTGGIVLAGDTCSFTVDVQVPAAASDGVYRNTTSNITVDLPATTELPPASDVLTVTSNLLALTKSFTDDPVTPGDAVTLEFTLSNLHASLDGSSIAFSDDLDAALPGLVSTAVLTNTCGFTITGVGTGNLDLTAGTVGAGTSCTFSATLTVPGMATAGTYTNTTSQVTGTIGGLPVTGDPASDDLLVQAMSFTKAFDGPTVAGGNPVLTFTIENQDTATGVDNIAFTDDLDAVVGGLVATGLPASDVCGVGSQLSGTSFLTLTGGNLGPSGTCTIAVTLQVPPVATPGTYTNTTSELSLAGLSVAPPASANLTVEPPPLFGKTFAPNPIFTGGTSTLTFTVDNTASALAASSLDFTDNLPAGVTIATPANATTTCTGGTLTAADGTAVITYTGGSVPASSSCTVAVDVTSGALGTYVNTSGELTSSSGNSGAASDTLTVEMPPAFSKSFAPNPIFAGAISTLTFTIDNTASTRTASNLDFTDTLPAGVIVASPPNSSVTCTGGTLSAAAGSSTIAYTGGSVLPSASCQITVDVTSNTGGTHVNTTGDLTSSSGNSGPASDTLTVDVPTTSFTAPTATGTGQATVTISGGGLGCGFATAAFIPVSTVAVPPPEGLLFPHGLLTFVLENCTPGATVDISIAYPPPLPADTELWKFGPTQAGPTPHWYTVPATLAAGVVSLSVTDGGLGDNDLAADGRIEDPLGPASRGLAPASIPSIGPWGLALLAIGLGLLGALRSRGRDATLGAG